MNKIYFLITLLLTATSLKAQTPAYSNGFDQLPATYKITMGVKHNKAIDLTNDASYRVPLVQNNPLQNYSGSFSVCAWVKAAKNATGEYAILSSKDSGADNKRGWEMGMQAGGAWYCKIQDANASYNYTPTWPKQGINNDRWHQLGFTFDTAKKEAAFYFDGLNVAIIHMPEISKLMCRKIFTGGIMSGYIGEWESFNGSICGVKIFSSLLPADFFLNEFNSVTGSKIKNKTLAVVNHFTAMNYNIFHGGNETGKEIGVQRIINVIKASNADIISMEETYGSGPAIADALGYYFYLRSTNLAIFSRYPIISTLPGGVPFNNGGALIEMPGKKKIAFYTNWITYPVDYWDLFEKKQPIDSAWWFSEQDKVNTQAMRHTLACISKYTDHEKDIPVIFCGDLNTGSHLDWVEATRSLNNGYVMPFPTTQLLLENGFTDSYRAIHPDPLKDRGITWSPQVASDFKDRIDYIFYKSDKIKPEMSEVITNYPVRSPSDHAAIITKFFWIN